jgi:GNAT superfamily N-acetyltransferase
VDEVLILRDFELRDQAHVRHLILDGLGEHWGEVDDSLNPDLDDIASSYAAGRTIVAELRGDVVATGTLVPLDGASPEIVRMSVAAGHRRTGLGRRIVEDLIQTARDWSSTRVVLETSSHWTDVVAFYLACGFEITGYRDGEFARDTWFERRL